MIFAHFAGHQVSLVEERLPMGNSELPYRKAPLAVGIWRQSWLGIIELECGFTVCNVGAPQRFTYLERG